MEFLPNSFPSILQVYSILVNDKKKISSNSELKPIQA